MAAARLLRAGRLSQAEIARHYRLRHQVRWVTRDDFGEALDPLLEAMDQPSIDGVNTYFVARAARGAAGRWRFRVSAGSRMFRDLRAELTPQVSILAAYG